MAKGSSGMRIPCFFIQFEIAVDIGVECRALVADDSLWVCADPHTRKND
jgi:hypothetical protein